MELYEYEKEHLKALRPHLAECTVLLKSNGDFPLARPCRIALYGSGARHTLKGGTGSGEVNSRFAVSVEEALCHTGFTITSGAWLDGYDREIARAKARFLKEVKAVARKKKVPAVLEGMGRVMPEPDYDLPMDAEGDAAVYVLARICGEGNDRKAEEGDFYLTETEIRDLHTMQQKYKTCMLVLNVGGPVDLSPVMDLDNILLLSQLGVDTGLALSRILVGKDNPSGRLTTTWAAATDYSWVGDFGEEDDTHYREGIYVGYRYFDSFGTKPLFPFGYGLSYTTFAMSNALVTAENGRLQVSAEVRNTGNRPGRQVIELYVSKPAGRLDQPYQELAGWAKTAELAPGESETVMIDAAMVDLASWDTENACYVLEKGDYVLRLGTDSRSTEPAAVVRLAEDVVVRRSACRCGTPDFEDWKPEQPVSETPEDVPVLAMNAADILSTAPEAADQTDEHASGQSGEDRTAGEKTAASGEKTAASGEETDGTKAADETGQPADIDAYLHGLTDEQLAYLNVGHFNPKRRLLTMVGDSAGSVAGAAGETTRALQDIGIGSLVMADGPAGLRLARHFVRGADGAHSLGSPVPESMLEYLPGAARWAMQTFLAYRPKRGEEVRDQFATAIPIGTAIAQSWNTDFAALCGDIVGDEMERFGVQLWLAPALNIHRHVLCGRNFEYYSEDPLVSGRFAAAITDGVQKHPGCGTTIKHFCVNNQETNRYTSNSQVSERAMREIYLRGFGICVRESQPHALMTSYNLLNGEHTNERKGLMEILREEFGYQGIVMTDWLLPEMKKKGSKYPAPTAWKIAAAGGDLIMPGSQAVYENLLEALKSGDLSRRQLEVNATRVYRMIQKLGK
ncbi:glycoside hydrolase family 3 N-terminal domain-containing protein [Chordicoccus furentiruminis]|uniref:glycoside hydrolase family 3 N-terminal domain-containing protein n=1 Tax=Chordicoccus furentiruminis TaxID=2709410 RepID=UPI0023A8DB66|nr:glycoside hydrolase family 3 N-terminal domain-containing protein [Chordicoccus furentiruminis]